MLGTPDDLGQTASRQDAFPYASYYAHASAAEKVPPIRVYDPTQVGVPTAILLPSGSRTRNRDAAARGTNTDLGTPL
jgi:hypothetical protein